MISCKTEKNVIKMSKPLDFKCNKCKEEFSIEYLSHAPYQVLKTKWLSFTELNKLQQVESLLNIFYNSGNFKLTIENLVKKFNKPFELFFNLAEYIYEIGDSSAISNWQKSAILLLEYIKHNLTKNLEFYLDCIRWDWCYLANAHQYPAFLNSKKLVQAKRIGFEFLKQKSKQNSIHFNGFNFNIDDLKKAIFFQPSSTEFKKKFMPDTELCIFIKFQNCKEYIKFNTK